MEIGDCIGTESCVDLGKWIGKSEKGSGGYVCNRRSEMKRRETTEKKFPPPIPLLARTENLAPHMPWILRRHYTSDGRLIIEREKVRHHEYFHAYRSGGRLTLWLIPLDDVVYGQGIDGAKSEEVVDVDDEEKSDVDVDVDYDERDYVDDASEDDPAGEDGRIEGSESDLTVENDDDPKLVISGSPGGACCNFSRDHEMTSFFRVTMPSVRPVYT